MISPRHFLLQFRRPLSVLLHIALIVAANTLAFSLRFGGATPPAYWSLWIATLPWLVAVRALVFVPFGLYVGMWRYTGISDLGSIAFGVLSSSLVFALLEAATGVAYPRSIILIDSLVLICLMSGARLSRRVHREVLARRGDKRVLIYGAGDAGAQIVQNMRDDPRSGYNPVGFVDDNPAKAGARIHGVPVVGTSHDIRRILDHCRPDEVVIAIPGGDSAAIRSLVRMLELFKIPIKTLPTLREIVDGRIDVKQIRGLAIEDLLARAPVGLDRRPLRRLIEGKRVMVTGAGGSIGSELCRQIASLKPAALVMVDRYENSLHEIRVQLDDQKHTFGVVPVIADVTDQSRVNGVLAEHRPEIVFHAAAHKHVPLMEENPCEAVKNNVRGTRLLAQAAEAHGVDRFIMVSTDKAVNPTSVMGASKRVAELVVQAQAVGSGTSFSIVRFGNVLGSNGSVVPRFIEQIKKGGPVTVTHPEMRRFFMLIPEAVQLVLHAASQAESGATYVLEMGEQVKLLDLARDLIRLSGLMPDEDIKIDFIGLRPGEKLYEELVGVDEHAQPSAVDKILCVRSARQPDARIFAAIEALEGAALAGHGELVIEAMKGLIGARERVDDATPNAEEQPTDHAAAAADARSRYEQPCPRCHVARVHRSHARTLPERLKKDFTAGRLFRCDVCGWRGWLEPLQVGQDAPGDPLPTPDLTSVDAVVMSRPAVPRPSFSPRNLH
ncbi:MAG: NAD-dependent epimerase/dehydratase family protein [Luteitalea sp.]|nr:NAD-dependent epimerase/dehydratase family protein [Luteitalea sp.]